METELTVDTSVKLIEQHSESKKKYILAKKKLTYNYSNGQVLTRRKGLEDGKVSRNR